MRKKMERKIGIYLTFLFSMLVGCFGDTTDMDDMKFDEDVFKLLFPSLAPSTDILHGARAPNYRIWDNMPEPGGKWRIPYVIDDSITSDVLKKSITDAIHDYETSLCFNFVPRSTEDYYMRFKDIGGGCSSYVGRRALSDQPNPIQLQQNGCHRKGTVIHEIMHALGFLHEHQRPDRDSYVIIHTNRIRSDRLHNFNKYSTASIDSRGVPYDYGSIMHYPSSAFPADGNSQTLTITKLDQSPITEYQRTGLASSDIEQLKIMYRCQDESSTTTDAATSTTDAATTTPTVSPMCPDVLGQTRCNRKWKRGICVRRPRKMKTKCASTCGLCDCQDQGRCGKRARRRCYRPRFISQMKENCPLTCGYCGEACQDIHQNCDSTMCDSQLAAKYCRRTCEFCITK